MASNKPESRLIKAAGAVAWRPGPDGEPEILLVHRKKYDDWSLPKGKVDPGEPLPVTAAREVLEEGGARLALGRRLRSVRYQVGGRPKRVHYWAARLTGTDQDAVPNAEVDQIAWATLEQAWERVSYGHDITILEDFARASADTFPLILLRHAKAEGKSGWKRDDISRPLDACGRADAKALADLLACFAPAPRLVSSPASRCVATLRPFAQLTGAPVQEAPALYMRDQAAGATGTDAADPVALIAEVIAAGQPAVFCAHRENIPDLQAAALAALGLSGLRSGIRDGAEPPAAPDRSREREELTLPRDWPAPLATASFWVLHLTRPKPQPAPAQALAHVPAGPRPGTRLPLRQRLRLRLRGLPGRRPPAQPTTTAQAAPPGPSVPPVTLVATDRYDITDA